MTTTIAVISDTHINSSVAVCPPTVQLDEGSYHASKAQRWLWSCWLDYCEQFSKRPGKRVVIINGDAGELDTKRRSLQMITTNKAFIQRLVADTLEPLVSVADAVYVVRGTAAHTGKSAWLEEWLAGDIDNAIGANGTKSWWHLRTNCEGVRLDVAHHAGMGRQPWTRANAANTLAAKTFYQYCEAGNLPPHLVIRSHNHAWADSGDNYAVRVLYTGAWTIATEYAYRMGGENELAQIGGMIVTCDDGNYNVEKIKYRPEKRNVWALKI